MSSTRSSSPITPAATIASTSATVKRRRGRPSAAVVTREAKGTFMSALSNKQGSSAATSLVE